MPNQYHWKLSLPGLRAGLRAWPTRELSNRRGSGARPLRQQIYIAQSDLSGGLEYGTRASLDYQSPGAHDSENLAGDNARLSGMAHRYEQKKPARQMARGIQT